MPDRKAFNNLKMFGKECKAECFSFSHRYAYPIFANREIEKKTKTHTQICISQLEIYIY